MPVKDSEESVELDIGFAVFQTGDIGFLRTDTLGYF